VALAATDLDRVVKELAALLSAEAPTLKLRLNGIAREGKVQVFEVFGRPPTDHETEWEPETILRCAFPTGRDLTRFCDDSNVDFGSVDWKQD
jgi:hypothetical protein